MFHGISLYFRKYVSRLPSYINRSNVQSFFDFCLEFHLCLGNSEQLHIKRIINCEVFIPKSVSGCGLCQVFRKHRTTMTHSADKAKSKSSSKYIPNKYMPQVDLERKTQ